MHNFFDSNFVTIILAEILIFKINIENMKLLKTSEIKPEFQTNIVSRKIQDANWKSGSVLANPRRTVTLIL